MNKVALTNAIKAAMDQAMTSSENSGADSDAIRTQFAQSLSDAMEDFVKTASITINPGLIQVTGTAAAQSNPAPIVIANGLS